MSSNLDALLYLVAGVLFILALRGLSSPETSRRGNYLGMTGMAIAVLTTLAVARPETPLTWAMIIVGIAFGSGTPGAIHTASLVDMSLVCAIGAVTFSGSVIAFLKLSGRMSGKPIML